MDNYDQNQNDISNEPEPENKSPKDEVPLWLQGLDNDKPDNTQPITSKSEDRDSWLPEGSQIGDEDNIFSDSEVTQDEQPPPTDSFGELNGQELMAEQNESEVLTHSQNEQDGYEKELTDVSFENESTEEINVEEFSEDDLGPESDVAIAEMPSPEGFVDISNLDLHETSSQQEEFMDVEVNKEGHLPEWLKEMISESEEPEIGVAEQISAEDVTIIKEPEAKLSSEWEVEHNDDEMPEDELTLDDHDLLSPYLDEQSNLEEALAIAKEDTSPLQLSSDADFEPSLSKDRLENSEDMQDLVMAEQYLDQGDFQKALKIVKGYADQSSELERIGSMLQKSVEKDEINNCDVWELLGDIAYKQNKPGQAFNAYTKAIGLLMEMDRYDNQTC